MVENKCIDCSLEGEEDCTNGGAVLGIDFISQNVVSDFSELVMGLTTSSFSIFLRIDLEAALVGSVNPVKTEESGGTSLITFSDIQVGNPLLGIIGL